MKAEGKTLALLRPRELRFLIEKKSQADFKEEKPKFQALAAQAEGRGNELCRDRADVDGRRPADPALRHAAGRIADALRSGRRVGKAAGRERVRRRAHQSAGFRFKKWWARRKSAFAHPTVWERPGRERINLPGERLVSSAMPL